MATKSPNKPNFKLPMPPAQLHTRPAPEFEMPNTPNGPAFTSPSQTPQGSPSKKQLPPGAHELPNVFENALKLMPTSGNPNKPAQAATSPTKAGRAPLTEGNANDFRSSVIQDDYAAQQLKHHGSGLNQENTPPSPGKLPPGSPFFPSSAAVSRQEAYRPREHIDSGPRSIPRGLSSEALEKLSKPSVKRLANVTQLCMHSPVKWVNSRANKTQTSSTTTLTC